MIDKATVERIMDSANIVDVIGDFVSLRKKGANYMACCPFHGEKTPSFSVSPARGIFKCFGCGKAGNSATFVMEHEKLTYVEALKYLAKKYGIEVEERELTEEEVRHNTDRESMMIVSAYAQQYFTDVLLNKPDGKAIGLTYFKERGFARATIDKFQLGYCSDSRSKFSDEAVKSGYKKEFLIKTGLSIQRDNGELFDRFYGRVLFPIHSLSGRVIAFGGRTLKTDKNVAKYLNSPESEIYIKSNSLYGIYFAKQSITRLQKCYLVEGYTDVISMHQAGIENTVASSGTSLTTEQIKLIARFTQNVTVLYDGDSAGIKASLRGIDMLLEQGMNIKVALLPDGEDPDSYARSHTADEFRSFLDVNETDFITFKIGLLLQDAQNDPLKKSAVISDVVKSISVIPDNITRTVFLKECSRLLDVDEDILRAEVAKLRNKKIFGGNASRQPSTDTPPMPIENTIESDGVAKTPSIPSFVSNIYCQEQEKELIDFMLRFGTRPLFSIPNEETGEDDSINVAQYITSEIRNDDLEFQNLYYRQIFEEYVTLLKDGDEEPSKHFINHSDLRICELSVNLLLISEEHKLSTIWNQGEKEIIDLTKAIPRAIAVYKSKIVNIAYTKLTEELHKAQENKNDDELQDILKRLMILLEQRKIFSNLLERLTI